MTHELHDAIDEHRGLIPRAIWIQVAIEEKLQREGSDYRPRLLMKIGAGPRTASRLMRPTTPSRKPKPTHRTLVDKDATIPPQEVAPLS